MKLIKYIQTLLVPALIMAVVPSASALKKVVIAGDMACAASHDGFLIHVDRMATQRCLKPSSGLFAKPGDDVTDSYVDYENDRETPEGSQTMVISLHETIAPSLADDIAYIVVAQDKLLADWTKADIDFVKSLAPDYIVWMGGSSDVYKATGASVYKDALTALLDKFEGTHVVLVQPSNSGRAYAQRASTDEYAMPSHTVENAVYEIGSQRHIPVVPTYALDLCDDGYTPRAASMITLGKMVGNAIISPEKANFTANITDVRPFELSLTVVDGTGVAPKVSTVYTLPAANHGFEVWRTNGPMARRLNVVSVTDNDGTFTVSTNERLTDGDILVYGCTAAGVGRQNGVRGNLATTLPVPLFTMTVNNVTSPDDNLTGTITCDGVGVPGVTVSDGYEFATTDVNGHYSMSSNKKLGYVFYSLPSGYEPETESNGWQVRIHSQLTSSDVADKEVHDFRLKKVSNDNHILLVGADAHLAARNQDKSQFKSGFMKGVKDFVAANKDVKIYSTILGDMSWDQYWYANSYGLPEFVETMTTQGYPVMLFPVMGNHDNDGATPAGSDCDFNAAAPFRRVMAPTYYSYNLGKVHYVVLDDIVYKNTFTPGKSYSEGIVGDRDYGRYYTDEQLEWLRHDLSLIPDKSTPVVVCFHVQNWAISTNGSFTVNANLDGKASENLAALLSDFSDVHLLSGHTHYNFHAHPLAFPNIHENNVAGICATWWWTGKLVDRHICKDGSPGGFAIYRADGKNLQWAYRSVDEGDDENTQFRVYDMNAVKKAYAEDADIKAWIKHDGTQTNYASVADNLVYINVFNYDTDWTVEVFEGDTPLAVKRIVAQDPLHVICYEVPRYKAANTVTADFVTNKTNHMFSAQATTPDKEITVRVTDSFGHTYMRTISRPGIYDTTLH